MRKSLLFLAVFCLIGGAVLFFALVPTARALETIPGGTIPAGQVINDDVSLSSDVVVIDGTVNGNVFANASAVTVNGVINGDLFVFAAQTVITGSIGGNVAFMGQSLNFNGKLGGSLFAAGGTVLLRPEAEVARNVLFIGYMLESRPGSKIGIDVSATASQLRLAGEIGRDVVGGAEGVLLSGKVGRNVTLGVSSPGQAGMPLAFTYPAGEDRPAVLRTGIDSGSEAQIGGTLTYISTEAQTEALKSISAARIVQAIPATEQAQPTLAQVIAQRILSGVHQFFTLLALSGLALWLRPALLERAAEKARRPLPSAGWGLLVWLLLPFLAGLFLLLDILLVIIFGSVSLSVLAWAVVGLGITWVGLAILLLTLLGYFGAVVVAQRVGQWAAQKFLHGHALHAFWPLAAALLVYAFLRLIPVLGELLALAITLIGVGAIWLEVSSLLSKKPAAAPPSPVVENA